jgi:hypothetical protein
MPQFLIVNHPSWDIVFTSGGLPEADDKKGDRFAYHLKPQKYRTHFEIRGI